MLLLHLPISTHLALHQVAQHVIHHVGERGQLSSQVRHHGLRGDVGHVVAELRPPPHQLHHLRSQLRRYPYDGLMLRRGVTRCWGGGCGLSVVKVGRFVANNGWKNVCMILYLSFYQQKIWIFISFYTCWKSCMKNMNLMCFFHQILSLYIIAGNIHLEMSTNKIKTSTWFFIQ